METIYPTERSSRIKPTWLILLSLFLFILWMLANLFSHATPKSEFRIIEVVSGHAWESHGKEVNDAIDCLNKNGSARSFKTSGFIDQLGNQIPTNMWLCYDGKDWYAVITTTFQKLSGNKVGRLVTAYKIAKETFPNIDSFVEYAVMKWSAFSISYIIEPGNIILQPIK